MASSRIRGLVPRLAPRQLVGGGVATAVVLAVSAVILVRLTATRPTDVVHDYLAAIQDRDPERALRAAGIDDRLSGKDAAFLTAPAIMSGWTFAITEVNTYTDEADVGIDLRDTTAHPDPALPAGFPVRHSGFFHLTKRSGRWRIENPYGAISVAPSVLPYVEIGGARQAVDAAELRARHSFLVFPGIYTPYSGRSDLVAVAAQRVIALPDFDKPGSGGVPYQPQIRLTARGQAAIQQAADDFLDRCVADMANHVAGCTLQNQDFVYRSASGYVATSAVQTATFTLVRRPTVTIQSASTTLDDGSLAFATQIAIPGEVHLAATGHNLDGRHISFAMTCLVNRAWLVVAVQADGTLATQWKRNTLDDRVRAAGPYVSLDCHA